jgi:hypothetical protein
LAALLVPAVAVAQTSESSAPVAAPDPQLDAARARFKTYAAMLSHLPLPISTEPAFQFKA